MSIAARPLRAAVAAALIAWAMPSRGERLSLEVATAGTSASATVADDLPDLLPHSRAARGTRDIAVAWLAAPTSRYRHGVLGDALEAGELRVRLRNGETRTFVLPEARVFEDLEPRLVDLDGDGRDEILVVESDREQGAALAVFGLRDGALERRGATPFIGQANRWLNPVGAGDFDGDGRLDLALVATPHIGGVLRLYRYAPEGLQLFAERRGVSTHRIGSTALGLGRVVPGAQRDRLLLPDQAHTTLLLLEWRDGAWAVVAAQPLPAPLASALTPLDAASWVLELADGRRFVLRLSP